MIKNFYEHYFNSFYLYLNSLSKALLYKKLLAILSFAIIIVKIIPYFNFDLKCLQKAR
jgi:hypothetical protein